MVSSLNKAFEKSGIDRAISAGIKSATARDVNCAVQAITHLATKIKELLIKPTCPITTELGRVLRELAALKKLGVMNDVPRPATKEPNENKANPQYLWVSPKKIDAAIPIKKSVPPVTAPILAALLIGIRLIIFEMLNLPKINALMKRM